MTEYIATTWSNISFDDNVMVKLKVGNYGTSRLRSIEPLKDNATEEEMKWYEITKLRVVGSK